MALAGGTFAVRWTWAQESPPVAREGAAKKESREPEKDYHQRSLEIYEFKKAAKSGPERGQEIFYYKCWYCHNEYSKGGAPQLKSLYKHPQLLSGQPVSDDTVKEKIRNGGAGMPAFRYTLNDADVSDLVSFLRDKCCFDPDNPPANPRYRAH
jgi:mono/diheme cytochrome c family protein